MVPHLYIGFLCLYLGGSLLETTVNKARNLPTGAISVKRAALVLFNLAISAPVFYLVDAHAHTLPAGYSNPVEWFLRVCGVILAEDVLFFIVHRAFHHPLLYKHVHAVHHTYKHPFAFVTFYAHPLEHLCANMAPAALAPFLVQLPASLLAPYLCMAVANAMVSHSRYGDDTHRIHHKHPRYNLGAAGIVDRLMGTYAAPHAAHEKKRDDTRA
jgi:lathosterol oxidase